MPKVLNPHLVHLVRMLADQQFHDGTSLGKALKLSRNAVWKTIQKLIGKGVAIETEKGVGYRLQESLYLLDQKQIQSAIPKDVKVTVLESVSSTNDFLLNLPASVKSQVVFTEEQTKGKGRLGRTWHSPFAKNIYFSYRTILQKDLSELAGLSLVISLAMIEVLRRFIEPNHLHVKWPNDVLCQDKKIAGSLVEVRAETHGVCHVVIGIGVNVNMSGEQQISQPWTSMSQILGHSLDRNQICMVLVPLLRTFLADFNRFGFAHFRSQWIKNDCLTNQKIMITQAQQKIFGKVLGVDQEGRLRLKHNDQSIHVYASGETSIIKKQD